MSADAWPTFLEFHETVHPQLLASARSAGLRDQDPDDVVQDVWLILLRVDPSKWTAPYAFTVLRNAIVHQFRRPRRPLVPLDAAAEPAATHSLGSRIDAAELVRKMMRLDRPENIALHVGRAEGLTNQELAARLGTTVGAVYSRVNDSRKRLGPIARQVQDGTGNGTYGLGIQATCVEADGRERPVRATCNPLVLDAAGVLHGRIRLASAVSAFQFGAVHLLDRGGRNAVPSVPFPITAASDPDVLELRALVGPAGRELQWPNDQVALFLFA